MHVSRKCVCKKNLEFKCWVSDLMLWAEEAALWWRACLTCSEPGFHPQHYKEEREAGGGKKIQWYPGIRNKSQFASQKNWFLRIIDFMCVSVYLHVCMSTTYIPGACRGQRRAPSSPELGLLMDIQGLQTERGSSVRTSAINRRATSPALQFSFSKVNEGSHLYHRDCL